MIENVVAICPSLERLDLVRDLTQSYLDVTPAPYPPLIIIASGREDGTEGWCTNQAALGPAIKCVRSEVPLSYAQAVNLGVAQYAQHEATPIQSGEEILLPPKAKWILLLNNDLTLQPGFWEGFEEMAALGYEIIGAKLLYPNSQIQHFGKWFTLDMYPFHILRYQPADHHLAQDPRQVPVVTFACVAIRRDIWDGLNGLDEGYQNGYEDDDFCLRARERGAQIGVHPKMLAIHKEAQTSGIDTSNKEVQWRRFKSIWIDSGRISWPLGIHLGWRFL